MNKIRVYEVSRQYAGPEEGGWWYTHYELLEEHYFPCFWFKRLLRKYEYFHDEWVINKLFAMGYTEGDYILIDIGDESLETIERPIYQ